MADNPSDNVQYIGHGLKVEIGYGDAPSTTPSSIRPGEQIKRSPTGEKIRKGMGADPSVMSPQTRPYSNEQKVATAFEMKNPNASPAKVPPVHKQVAALTSLMARQAKR